ncbi:hypothetical protein [Rubrimonas cliftonensis]|uniref:Uncharacterized protein n=1 Tax=Rubrimonas cliftonensis TaxID=89524 RepID=A0A1H3VPV5_9RHOB|nr:hypothetical protein [Rubrimonas cliftonensis]SDZ76711.1 hypothetical protein SAMN05444370_101245 [Rubrimonas cliftonensis]
MTETPGELRDWRQTLPLASALGAGLGALTRPRGPRVGAGWTLAALADFALLFAVGHGVIEGSLAAAWAGLRGAAATLLGWTGAVALALGAVAGWLAGRLARSKPRLAPGASGRDDARAADDPAPR